MGGVRCVVRGVEGCGEMEGVGGVEYGGRRKVCGVRGGGEIERVVCGWGR